MIDTIIAIWILGIPFACALTAWLNRFVPVSNDALIMDAIWPVVLITSVFHIAFSGLQNPSGGAQ